MMPISMVLKSGSGEVVRRSAVPYVITDPISEPAADGLLSGVDPVGKTVFNARQMRSLIDEATDEMSSAHGERRDALLALIDLCREGQRPPHRLLWFFGD